MKPGQFPTIEPAYAFPGDPAALEKALRERHHEQKSKMVELMRLMSEIVKRFDEGPA
jgi:hypothetical protein